MSSNSLVEHPTWKMFDSTKIQAYMDCPRQFFYNYVLGWRTTAPNHHLAFGNAWHKAMEYLLLNGYSELSVVRAYEAFMKEFLVEIDERSGIDLGAKTPQNALNALNQYAETYKHDMNDFEVFYTEISGVVLIAEDTPVHFKMDSILKDSEGKIFSQEHKTGSQLSSKWEEKWMLSTQVGTYTHVMYCLYPPEEVKGVKINGTFFYKSKPPVFRRVPVWKTKQQMQVWLFNTLWWVDQMKHDMELLSVQSEDQPVLECFPMNTENCTKYFGCPYFDFCCAWPNPLSHAEEPPLGLKIQFWNPEEEQTTNKIVIA